MEWNVSGVSKRLLGCYPTLVDSILEVKLAAAQANRISGVIQQDAADQITHAILFFKEKIFHEKSSVQASYLGYSFELVELFSSDVLAGGGSICLHLNVSELIADRARVPVRWVDLSQSTADVFHTAFRIAIYRDVQPLFKILDDILGTLARQAQDWKELHTLSRTCLQDALSISFGENWKNYFEAISRRRDAIALAAQQLLRVNLGGTVVGSREGATPAYFDAVLERLRALTNLDLSRSVNLYDASQNSDDLASFHSALALLAQVLTKFARDLRLLASGPNGGLGEIKLPKVQESSSFFANKVNPILPESIIQCGFQVMGSDYSIQLALQNAELNLNVYEGSIVANVLDSLRDLTTCLEKFHSHCLIGLHPDFERCEALARLQHAQKGERE